MKRDCEVGFYGGECYIVCKCIYYDYGAQVTPPMVKVKEDAGPVLIGEKVQEVLLHSKRTLPADERIDRLDEFLQFVGATNWKTYVRNVEALAIYSSGDEIKVTPLIAEGNGLAYRGEKGKICLDDPKEIGKTVLELRKFCKPGAEV